jgi:hypothetical protein
MAVLVEDSREMIISSSSFSRDDWTCISCDKAHPLLPLKMDKNNWRDGRKLIFLSDQNFPAILPGRDESCPIVFRVEGGLLREIGIAFLNMLGDFSIPEGSVIVIGSLSHLMEEGRVGYSKGLVTEYIRFSKAFKNTVHVVPFLPPPICGTNDPELLRAMMDISVWIEKLQKFKLSEYYSELRAYITSYSGGLEQTIQNTQRHKMPKAFEAYNDKNFMCHEWAGLGSSLQTMDGESERSLIGLILSSLSSAFRWNLDDNPNLSRTPTARPANSAGLMPSTPSAPLGVLVGGSNTFRLTKAFEEMGKPVESLVASGWSITMGSIDSLLPNLSAILAKSDTGLPVVFWCLDNSCFRALTAGGDLVAISKQKDKKFHVTGELTVAPFSLLNNVMRELKRAIDACGNRLVLVMEVVPRFLLRPCCEDPTHCSNTRQLDSTGVAAGKRILHDLADLNMKMADYLSASNVRYISTGDLLAGSDNCTMGELMDALYSCWSTDPVHGDKIAYHRVAMGLLNILSRKVSEGDLRNSLNPKKRGREDASPPRRRRSSDDSAYGSTYGSSSGNSSRRSSSPSGRRSSYRRDY